MNTTTCKNIKHKGSYNYACPKCRYVCLKRKKPLKNGNWCNCECKHNTFWCHICNNPVGFINGMYYFVSLEEKK